MTANLETMENQMESPTNVKTPGIIGRLKSWGPLAALGAVMVFAFANGWHQHLSLSNIIMNRELLLGYVENNYLLAVLAYCGIYIAAVALSFPGASLITIVSGFLFGWISGGIYTAISATIGATIIFKIASTSFGSVLQEKAGPRLAKLADGFEKNAFSYLLFLRLVPLFPFWLINLAPALFKVSTWHYITATFIGILPGTFAYALLGEGLDSLVAAQETANPGCAAAGTCEIDLTAAITPEIIAALVGLAVVSILPIIIQKVRAAKS